MSKEARDSVVGWGTMLQAGRSPVQVPSEVDLFRLPNSSSRTMALGLTQPLTNMSTRNLPGSKKWPPHRADNLASVCEPNVEASNSRNPKDLHGLYRDNFTFKWAKKFHSVYVQKSVPAAMWVSLWDVKCSGHPRTSVNVCCRYGW
jgi:hypothetical protein